MSTHSAIEWTDLTWNPLAGCTWASPGCDHCYAAVMARRLGFMAEADLAAGREPGQKRKYIGITNKNRAGRIMFNGKVNLDYDAINEPLHWKKPRRVFVNSMSDLFHKDVPDTFIRWVFTVMQYTPQHTYQVLTKRPERMATWAATYGDWPANVWAGTSVENQAAADTRIPHLLKVPARVRFLSCEPLLGPVDLLRLMVATPCWRCGNLDGEAGRCYCGVSINPEIHWVIVGGESGHGARPMHPDWARSLRDQCKDAGVSYFFKQWGEYHPEPWSKSNPKPAIALRADGSSVYAQVGHVAGFRYPDEVCMERIGKHAAGRLLDGREWNEVPA